MNSRGQGKILDFGLAKIEVKKSDEDGSGMQTAVRPEELTKAGSAIGTVSYMSPEQAKGQPTDARTDIFSLGTVLYQMATGTQPFFGRDLGGDLRQDPQQGASAGQSDQSRAASGTVQDFSKALKKDRNLRYQTANDLKTDLMRLKRDQETGARRLSESSDSQAQTHAEKSIAVLYLENLSGVKEDEYLRDAAIHACIITELSKIKNLKIFSRPTVLAYRDKQVTPLQIGQQLGAAYVLTGSLR